MEATRKQNPSDFLKQIIGRPVVVKLNSGVDYRGVLACLDGYMNIALEQTEEYVNGQLKSKYGDAFIRGNNGMDYDSLTDDEIRSRLTDAGVPFGPILDSTRSVYIRKLKRLAGELPVVSSPVEIEDDDEEEPPPPAAVVRQRPMTAKVRTPPKTSGDTSTGETKQKRHQRKLDVPISKVVTEPSGGGIVGVIVKLVIFLIILAAVFYFIGLSYETENPGITTD